MEINKTDKECPESPGPSTGASPLTLLPKPVMNTIGHALSDPSPRQTPICRNTWIHILRQRLLFTQSCQVTGVGPMHDT